MPQKLKIVSVVGARPNFIKIAPFVKAIVEHNKVAGSETATYKDIIIEHILVHTGQHYDSSMSESFFKLLDIPEPDINLGVGSGSHAEQVGKTMIEFEKVLHRIQPDWVVVVGDVNATLACSITAKKEHIKCCHIEAGLRSGDLSMPEEINRLVTDRLSDLLLTPDKISTQNLLNEGVDQSKIRFVGNIMIDTLEMNRSKAERLNISHILENNLIDKIHPIPITLPDYGIMTLHRPSNVDDKKSLGSIVDFVINEVLNELSLIWTIHPRTKKQLILSNLWEKLQGINNLILLNPIGYLELLKLNMEARLVLTDSGGLQEECTVLGTPCLTMRFNTERPVTLKKFGGVSVLVGNDPVMLTKEFRKTLKSNKKPSIPELWDGQSASRCLKAILEASDLV